MIESIVINDYQITDEGIIVSSAMFNFLILASERDCHHLEQQQTPATFWTELESSDEDLLLLGFSSIERRRLYRVLKKINGIGRKSALIVLNCGETRDTLRAVASEDYDYFNQVPGLGKAKITAILKKMKTVYKSALPSKSNIPIQDWVTAREALLLIAESQGVDYGNDKIDILISDYQQENSGSAEEIIETLKVKIAP